MIKRKYSDFLLYNLMESVMTSTTEMLELLSGLSSSDYIAEYLYNLIRNSKDIKTNVNYLGLSPDKNDEFLFLPDNQYQRFISKGEDVSKRTMSKISIGRMIGQIFRDNNITTVPDKDIERFVNRFKSAWNRKHGIINRKIQIVNGDSIKKWYNETNYLTGKSTLGSSCMRYDRCEPYLDIYAKNPDKCQLVILTEDDKLIARALFWTLDKCSLSKIKYYLDRIYVENDSDYDFVQNWVYENLGDKNGDESIASYYASDMPNNMRVNLKQVAFNLYPYADTMMYVYKKLENGVPTESGFISNYFDGDDVPDNYIVYQIRDTSGDAELYYGRYSKAMNKWYRNEDVIYIDNRDDYLPMSECKICEFNDTYILTQNAIWSESMGTWIPKDESIEHKEFGIVMKAAIRPCVEEYTGGLTSPIDVYQQLEGGVNTQHFKFSSKLMKRENQIDGYLYPEYEVYGLWGYPFNEKLIITDVSNSYQFKYFCFEMSRYSSYSYDVGLQIDSDNLKGMIRSTWTSGYNVLPEDAKILKLKPTDKVGYMYVCNYAKGFKESNYSELIELTNKSEVLNKDEKDKLLKIRKWVHEYLLDSYESYKKHFTLTNIFKSTNKQQIYSKVIHDVYEDMMSSNRERITQLITKKVEEIGLEKDENRINILINLIEVFCGYYYLTSDSYDSRNLLYSEIDGTDYYSGLLGWSKSMSILDILDLVLRSAFRDGIDKMSHESMKKILSKISSDHKLSDDIILNAIRIRTGEYQPFKK